MSKLIGISGKIGSGKDTFAKMIQHVLYKKYVNSLGRDFDSPFSEFKDFPKRKRDNLSGFVTKRFADKLKDTVCLWLGCSREQLEDREFKEKPLGEEWNKFRLTWQENNQLCEKIYGDLDKAHNAQQVKSIIDTNAQVEIIKFTPRKLMQLLGTECGREIIHPNIWVNATFAPWDDDCEWIITDMRFPNEWYAVDHKGGINIRVERKLENRFPEIYMEYGYRSNDAAEMRDMLRGYIHREYPELDEKLSHPSETSLDDQEGWDYLIYNDYSLEKLYEIATKIVEEEDL